MTIQINGANGLTFPDTSSQAVASKVLQVVQATYAAQVSTTSSSYVTTNLTATITPKFATSKIFAIACIAGSTYGSSNVGGGFQIQRGGVIVSGSISGSSYLVYTSTAEVNWPLTLTGIDSPATTSAVTYTVYMNAQSGTTIAHSNNNTSYIQLFEIAP